MGSRRLTGTDVLALVWGIAEGVIFFVVPDVLLTYVAIRHGTRRGLRAVRWALGGAVVGGLIAFGWGATDPISANTTMAALPAIGPDMVETVHRQIATNGPAALVTAPLSGRPYKLYAAAAGQFGMSPLSLALWTIPGRLWRFVGLVVVFGGIERASHRRCGAAPRMRFGVWASFWIIVYVRFWAV